jgi:hypothetical protein
MPFGSSLLNYSRLTINKACKIQLVDEIKNSITKAGVVGYSPVKGLYYAAIIF